MAGRVKEAPAAHDLASRRKLAPALNEVARLQGLGLYGLYGTQDASTMISVTIVTPEDALNAPWEDLAPFAHNAFMQPAALKAAADTMLAVISVLVAWDMSVEPARLVGLWAMQSKQLLFWHFLEMLPYEYAFLSTPVINPAYAEEVMPAFLAAVARDKSLPDTMLLRDLDATGSEHGALEHALRGHARLDLRRDQRPVATRESGIKRSGSTRKKLKQDWNRLAATGPVEVVNLREPAAAREALEIFLAMEAASWKGKSGTALLNDPKDAAFARRLIGDLAARGDASVALLKVDQQPIAAQVLLYCGRTAYTWKISFDPEFSRYSPGALLVDRVMTDLLDSGAVDTVDTCARGDSFMAQVLSARKPMVDMVTSARPGLSLGYLAVATYFRGRELMKSWRGRLRRRAPAPRQPQPMPPAAADRPAPPEPSLQSPRADRAA